MGEIAVHLYRETCYDADVALMMKKKKVTVMEVVLNAGDGGFGAVEAVASSSSS